MGEKKRKSGLSIVLATIIISIIIVVALIIGIVVMLGISQTTGDDSIIAKAVETFNQEFIEYEGENIAGGNINELISNVEISNSKYSEKITITMIDKDTQEEVGISEAGISETGMYSVECKYNEESGHINQIIITGSFAEEIQLNELSDEIENMAEMITGTELDLLIDKVVENNINEENKIGISVVREDESLASISGEEAIVRESISPAISNSYYKVENEKDYISGYVNVIKITHIGEVVEENNLSNSDIYSIDERVTVSNNYFKYENYNFEINEIALMIWEGTITNISNEIMNMNISVKLYDMNKELIGEYQYYELGEELSQTMSLEPNASNKPFFNVYEDDLIEGKTLSDIAYYSIEDLK